MVINKKLSRFIEKAPLFFFLGLISFSMGCKKKDRLSASTFSFSVVPPATSLVKGSSLTLVARGQSNGQTVDTNPDWSLSGAAVTSLNTSVGPSVIFTPTTLGDVVVTATYDGMVATSKIAVVTYKPSTSTVESNTYNVYNDHGIPTGAALIVGPPTLDIVERSSGYTPDGNLYQRVTNGAVNSFWGVSLAPTTADLSAFNSGKLRFALRLPSGLNSSSIQIEITDRTGVAFPYVLVDGVYGFDANSTDWQEIAIDRSAFALTLDMQRVRVPFAVVVKTQALTYDIDAVRWTKS